MVKILPVGFDHVTMLILILTHNSRISEFFDGILGKKTV